MIGGVYIRLPAACKVKIGPGHCNAKTDTAMCISLVGALTLLIDPRDQNGMLWLTNCVLHEKALWTSAWLTAEKEHIVVCITGSCLKASLSH